MPVTPGERGIRRTKKKTRTVSLADEQAKRLKVEDKLEQVLKHAGKKIQKEIQGTST